MVLGITIRPLPHDEEAAERGEVVGGQQRQPVLYDTIIYYSMTYYNIV